MIRSIVYSVFLAIAIVNIGIAQEYAFEDSVLAPKVSALYLGEIDTISYSDFIPDADYWYPQVDIPHLGLGFVGSPSRSILPIQPVASGFHLGLDAADVYRISADRFYYYPGNTSITDFTYHQGEKQVDGVFKSLFSGTFKNNINVTFQYERQNNEGFYQRQSIRNTILGLGLRHVSKGRKWQLQFEHFANTFRHNHNGGITTDTLSKSAFDIGMRLDVNTALENASAESRDEERIIRLVNYYRLGAPDSVSIEPTGLLFYHVLELNNRDYLYADALANEDTNNSFYNGFLGNESSFIRDDRGMRFSIEKRSISNELHVAFKSKNLKQQFDLGAAVRQHSLDLETEKSDVTEIQALGQLRWQLTPFINLKGGAIVGTTDDVFNYFLNGSIHIEPRPNILLSAYVRSALRQPSLISQKAFSTLSSDALWENDWNQEFFNSLKGEISLRKLGLRLGLEQNTITDFIYFNTEALPQQNSGAITLINAQAIHEFQLGKWIFENDIIYQRLDNQDLFRTPELFTRHNLYFRSRIFRGATIIKTGVQVEYQGASQGVRYQPIIAQFIQSDSALDDYFMLNYYFRFDVNRFNATVHLFNLTDFFNDKIRYQTSFYPYERFTFRIGIHWLFLN